MTRTFPELRHPIVQAPMAGGPSTPALAAAVSGAGGLGFLAAGYRSPEALAAEIAQTRALTSAAFGVNVFRVEEVSVDAARLAAYGASILPDARRHGVGLGEPCFDDDGFEGKLDVVCRERPAIVSFTFGCPPPDVVGRLHAAGVAVWCTVTDADEARIAGRAGVDALVVQGVEAGGHRGSFVDADGAGEIGLLALLRLVARVSDLPLVATGGIADGAGVAAVLAAGARAAQIGTAFMGCPEAATSAAHREALRRPGATALTRAFTGRRARGIVNAFMRDHDADAPTAYPHVNAMTGPLRVSARAAGDDQAFNLWAGQAHALIADGSAADLVRRFAAEARRCLDRARAALDVADPMAQRGGRS